MTHIQKAVLGLRSYRGQQENCSSKAQLAVPPFLKKYDMFCFFSPKKPHPEESLVQKTQALSFISLSGYHCHTDVHVDSHIFSIIDCECGKLLIGPM